MAAKAKKRGRRTQAKRQTKRQGKKSNIETSFVRTEIIIWMTLAVSILLMISNFGFGGFAGEAVAELLAGMFGWAAYVIPFLLFGIVTFIISNQGNPNAYVKAAASVCLTVLSCTFLQLVDESGGKIGVLLVDKLVPAIGVAGTYVVDIILMIICLVVITGKSALKSVKSQSDRVYGRAKRDVERRREMAEERRRQKEASAKEISPKEVSGTKKRSARHVEGVSFDTAIAKKSPNVRELSAEAPDVRDGLVINRGEDAFAQDSSSESGIVPKTEEPVAVSAGQENLAGQAFAGASEEVVRDVSEDALYEAPKEEPRKEPEIKPRSRRTKGEDVEDHAAEVASAVAAESQKPKKAYRIPPLSLLKKGSRQKGESDAQLRETAMKLQQILQNFGVKATVTNVSCGPSVTRYELQPEMGVKVSKIVGLSDDIKLNLAAADIRIEAPIPGKAAVGIEVPNKENSAVMLRDLLESGEFRQSASKISFAVGKDIGGKAVVTDIGKMPHVLIAGATGSGKSVCINTLIMSILYKATPEEVKLIMIDPKVVELSVYNGIPHLMIPVVTDPKKAAGALNWAVAEMDRRYRSFAEYGVRDMKGYNEKVSSMPPAEDGQRQEPLPQIVVIVDELADLMMVAPGEVEGSICRLAQLARAAGIHLVIATQRPSVNVITGLIKANMPSRIAFSVSSGVDSRTIIDMNGAEKLLGKGDMLFYPSGYQKPARVQGSFVTDKEVQDVVEFLKDHNEEVTYDEEVVNHVNTNPAVSMAAAGAAPEGDGHDAYFMEAGKLIIDKDKASIGMLQRAFKIGFNRAARIMDQLAEEGVVGPEEGTKPRKVLMSQEEFEQYAAENS